MKVNLKKDSFTFLATKNGYESKKKFKIPAHFGLHARTQSRNLAIHFILF
jgi:hypothetical protein